MGKLLRQAGRKAREAGGASTEQPSGMQRARGRKHAPPEDRSEIDNHTLDLGGRDLDGYSSTKLKNSSSWFTAVFYSGGSVHVRVRKGGIHHDSVQPGRDCGIAVNAGGAVGLFPEDVCVSDVPSGFFDHVDVDPP
jgi:hypothetical protein